MVVQSPVAIMSGASVSVAAEDACFDGSSGSSSSESMVIVE